MSIKKVRVSRGIGANVGIQRAYKKDLIKISNDFRSFVANEILLFLENKRALTADSLKPMTSEERRKLKVVKQKILSNVAKNNPALLKNDIDKFISEHIGLWSELLAGASVTRVTKYINKMAFMTSDAQRRSFINAKVTKGLVNKAFTVPTIKNRYISQNALNALPDLVKENVNLITKINVEDVNRISDVILNGLQNGDSFNQLKEALKATEGFSDSRAERVATDQSNKISQLIQAENAKAMGVKEAIWIHVAGKYSSRESHIKMNGKRFKLSEGCYDEYEGRNIMPAELINCKCQMQMIFDEEYLNG